MDKPLIDILWVLLSATLVFLMQPGFMCLESGLTRSKNSINVASKNLMDFVVSVGCFWLVGFGIMFTPGLVGFMPPLDEPWPAAFFLFQAVFCGTATTIFAGAVAERMKFSSYLMVAALTAAFVYPLFGQMAWGGLLDADNAGWLEARGFVDFAGSTVVHSMGGWVALAALVVIGPRIGRFNRDGSVNDINSSNLPMAVLGALLLWIGWIGFNGGSTLTMDRAVPGIIVHTCLAGVAGAASCMFVGWRVTGVAKVSFIVNGSLGGLVAITANCHCVSTSEAVFIGLVAGPLCFGCERLLERFRIDDAIGAVPVHLACGIWGTVAVALFGDPEMLGTGLSVFDQFLVQLLGIFTAFLVGFVLPLLLLLTINRIKPLRVTPEQEEVGLNVTEHGAKTELAALFQAMDAQANSGDLNIRAPEEPFTEVGNIARRYNQVMDALQTAVSKTEAVFAGAADAIFTFSRDTCSIINCNPAAERMFGMPRAQLVGADLTTLFTELDAEGVSCLPERRRVELSGVRNGGGKFPVEALVTTSDAGDDAFYIGTFRDITVRKEADAAIRRSETRYRDFFENTGTANFVDEPSGRIILVNQEFASLVGWKKEEIEGRMSLADFFHPDELPLIQAHHTARLADREAPRNYESRIVSRRGAVIPVYMTVSVIPGADNTLNSILDISEQAAALQALQRQQAHFRQLFDSSPLGISLVDQEGRILEVNPAFETMFGLQAAQARGQFSRSLLVPEEHLGEVNAVRANILAGRNVNSETWRLHSDGRRIPVAMLGHPVEVDGEIMGLYYIYQDITERKRFERELAHQAFHDDLTGLPNRALLLERLDHAAKRSRRREEYDFAVVMVDLDGFKKINDSLGHTAGDRYLIETGKRLQACVREVDTVARLGGDEFALLLEEVGKPRETIAVVQRILKDVAMPVLHEQEELFASASVGIVIKTRKYDNPHDILRDADTAMYRAKELGKNRFKVFNRSMHDQALHLLRLENDLRRAVDEAQLHLEYQPIVSVNEGRINGFEALVRWNHPERGPLSPGEFIPVAEESGLILPLGDLVIEEACAQLRRWRERLPDGGDLAMSVNLSSRQLHQKDLVEFVARCLEKNGIEPSRLKLEITESVLMDNATATIDKLFKLRELGVKLVIDDFGTGYSSLSYLQQFPIDSLKIDRSFISGGSNQDDPVIATENLEIVKAVISLARSLNLLVVAEGVENEGQLEMLKDVKCDEAQGFFLSRPVPAETAFELALNGLDDR